jgi:hypothetical protein
MLLGFGIVNYFCTSIGEKQTVKQEQNLEAK